LSFASSVTSPTILLSLRSQDIVAEAPRALTLASDPSVQSERTVTISGGSLWVRLLRVRDLNLLRGRLEGERSRENGGSWRSVRTRPRELDCPSIRKQGSCDSGYRAVADPRYQIYDFVRHSTICYAGLRCLPSPCEHKIQSPISDVAPLTRSGQRCGAPESLRLIPRGLNQIARRVQSGGRSGWLRGAAAETSCDRYSPELLQPPRRVLPSSLRGSRRRP
jgi:hypothetical protein